MIEEESGSLWPVRRDVGSRVLKAFPPRSAPGAEISEACEVKEGAEENGGDRKVGNLGKSFS